MIDEIVADYQGSFSGTTTPGSRPVQMHVNLFPVVEGEATPEPQNDQAQTPSNDGGQP